MKRLLINLFFLILIASCSSYENPICDSSNIQDIPNFEGVYKIDVPTFDHKTDSRIVTISRIAEGIYDIGDEQLDTATTCHIDSLYYLESTQSSSAIPRLSLQKVERNVDGSFDLIFMNADKDLLDQQNIPYEMIKVNNDNLLAKNNPQQEITILFILNKNLSSSEMLNILDPMSLKITLKPHFI